MDDLQRYQLRWCVVIAVIFAAVFMPKIKWQTLPFLGTPTTEFMAAPTTLGSPLPRLGSDPISELLKCRAGAPTMSVQETDENDVVFVNDVYSCGSLGFWQSFQGKDVVHTHPALWPGLHKILSKANKPLPDFLPEGEWQYEYLTNLHKIQKQ